MTASWVMTTIICAFHTKYPDLQDTVPKLDSGMSPCLLVTLKEFHNPKFKKSRQIQGSLSSVVEDG